MKKEDTEMMLRIFETERAGYAYLYPSDGGERKEDYISTTAENIANYIGSHMFEAEKIVITDMCDRLILDTCGYFINSCPNQEFCKEINPFLIPIQMGEKDAGEVLSVSRDVSEQYFREEDEAATMADEQPEAFAAMPVSMPVTRLDETKAARSQTVCHIG